MDNETTDAKIDELEKKIELICIEFKFLKDMNLIQNPNQRIFREEFNSLVMQLDNFKNSKIN